eukprot:7245208-Pyramimonas_sp.AAC.1
MPDRETKALSRAVAGRASAEKCAGRLCVISVSVANSWRRRARSRRHCPSCDMGRQRAAGSRRLNDGAALALKSPAATD